MSRDFGVHICLDDDYVAKPRVIRPRNPGAPGMVIERTATSARGLLDCGGTLDVDARPGGLLKGEAVSIGICPKNTKLVAGVENNSAFTGTVDIIEHLGEVQIFYLDLLGTSEKFLVKVDEERAFAPASLVVPRVPAGHLHLRCR